MHIVFNLSARYPCNLLCFRNAEREFDPVERVVSLLVRNEPTAI